jgi:hypothetical protein
MRNKAPNSKRKVVSMEVNSISKSMVMIKEFFSEISSNGIVGTIRVFCFELRLEYRRKKN